MMFDSDWRVTIYFDPAGFAIDWVADEYVADPTSNDARVNMALPMGLGRP